MFGMHDVNKNKTRSLVSALGSRPRTTIVIVASSLSLCHPSSSELDVVGLLFSILLARLDLVVRLLADIFRVASQRLKDLRRKR